MITDCPVCRTPLGAQNLPDENLMHYIRCIRCSEYYVEHCIAREFLDSLSVVQRGTISGWLRQNHHSRIDGTSVERVRRMSPLPVAEQGDRLLLHYAKEQPQPGLFFAVRYDDPVLQAIAWAYGENHMLYLLRSYLLHNKYIETPSGTINSVGSQVVITPDGWKHVDAVQSRNGESAYAFVAMYFHDSTNDVRRAPSDAIVAAGYRALIIDEHIHANLIVDEMLAAIRRSRFLVADFTGQRGGVYFEAGFAQGLGLPVIRTCKEDQLSSLHFDVNHYPFIRWQPTDLNTFVRKLQAQIEVLVGRGPLASNS